MNIDKLKDMITKKETQVQKIEKRIKKWETAQSEKGFMKRYDWLINNDDVESVKNRFWNEYIDECKREEKMARQDLEEAKTQLQKYNNNLDLIINRNNATKVQVFVDFLNQWKKQATEYIKNNITLLLDYYNINNQLCDLHNNKYKYLQEMSQDAYKEQVNKLKQQERELQQAIHPWTREVYNKKSEDYIDHTKLDALLDKEVEIKYWNMVNKVNTIVGEITDATNLRMGRDGNINGVIIGNSGKARLETIIAGGYNQNIIVNERHGQIAHFRLLVHPIKD